MANKLYEETHIQAIADAIREKDGSTDTMLVSEMAEKISAISGGGGDAGGLDALIDGSITEVTSDVNEVSDYAFAYKNNLKNANFPNATTLGLSSFTHSSNLTSVNAEKVALLKPGVFYNCTNLKNVDFPNVTNVGTNAFYGCSSLINMRFPKATVIGSDCFRHCTNLERLCFLNLTKIDSNAFADCERLISLRLQSSECCTLANANAFYRTCIKSGTGYIYVPSSLIEDYKVATNWTTFADRFRALEDYTVDGTITGELDETKIAA